MNQASVLKSMWRAVIAALSFAIPLLTLALPNWESITVGAVVYGVLHYAQTMIGI